MEQYIYIYIYIYCVETNNFHFFLQISHVLNATRNYLSSFTGHSYFDSERVIIMISRP